MRILCVIAAMWTSLPAHASPTSSWDVLLARLTSPVQARWTPEEALPHLTMACDARTTAACRLELGEALQPVLRTACEEGDDSACLGSALVRQDAAPRESFATFERLCAQNVGEACVFVAMARFEGRGTWQARRGGRAIAEELCADGVGSGCVALAQMIGDARPLAQTLALQRARRLGATGASGELARIAPVGPERTKALTTACDEGSANACWELAVQGVDPSMLAERACGLGRHAACVTSAALALENGTLDRPQAVTHMDRLCKEGQREACVAGAIFETGGSVPAFPTGTMGLTQRSMTVDERLAYVLDCYREQLERGDPGIRHLAIELAIGADGVFLGATAMTDDRVAEQCYAAAFIGAQGQRPSAGPARFRVDVTLAHEAQIRVGPRGEAQQGQNLSHLEWRLIGQLGLDANTCYLDHGGSVYDKQFAILHGTLTRDGWYQHEAVIESSGDADTDTCVTALISPFHTPEVQMPFDQEVWIRLDFNQVSRAPRWVGYGARRKNLPPMDLSLYNHAAGPRPTWRDNEHATRAP